MRLGVSLVVDWGEVKLVQRICLLWIQFDFGDSMVVMGLYLEFEVLLKVQQLFESHFLKCRVLALMVLA